MDRFVLHLGQQRSDFVKTLDTGIALSKFFLEWKTKQARRQGPTSVPCLVDGTRHNKVVCSIVTCFGDV